jgi:hypothetical protein
LTVTRRVYLEYPLTVVPAVLTARTVRQLEMLTSAIIEAAARVPIWC